MQQAAPPGLLDGARPFVGRPLSVTVERLRAPSEMPKPCLPKFAGLDDPNCADDDNDGAVVGFDCNDHDPAISPFAHDTFCDGIDQNCNGYDECDHDGDGLANNYDCDDADPAVTDECHPPTPASSP